MAGPNPGVVCGKSATVTGFHCPFFCVIGSVRARAIRSRESKHRNVQKRPAGGRGWVQFEAMQATAHPARWYEASCSFSNSFYRHFSFYRHIISRRAVSRYGGGTCCGARSGRREKEGQSSQPMFTLPPRQPPSPLARPRRTYSAQSGDGTGAVKSVRRGRRVEFDQARVQEEASRHRGRPEDGSHSYLAPTIIFAREYWPGVMASRNNCQCAPRRTGAGQRDGEGGGTWTAGPPCAWPTPPGRP